MRHYTYRITDKLLNMHYYGVRTCSCDPSKDIGYRYFSSSKDSSFISRQKNTRSDFKYKVISEFPTRDAALLHEAKLHDRLDVAHNPLFYNKINAGVFVEKGKVINRALEKHMINIRTNPIIAEVCGNPNFTVCYVEGYRHVHEQIICDQRNDALTRELTEIFADSNPDIL